MRHFILLCFVLLLPICIFSQKNKRLKTSFSVAIDSIRLRSIYENNYANAIELNDEDETIHALHNLSSLSPSDTLIVKKLLFAYFNTKKYEQSYILAKKYTDVYREDIVFLDVYAKSSEFLGRNGDAVLGFKKLYSLTGNSYYGYLTAFEEWVLGRYPECEISVNALFTAPDINTRFVNIAADNTEQEVPLIAAVYNLQGMLLNKLGKKEEALRAFKVSLERLPEFKAAQINLKYLTERGNK
jgi:tetratricopeptide (TPR) repeat protein